MQQSQTVTLPQLPDLREVTRQFWQELLNGLTGRTPTTEPTPDGVHGGESQWR